MRIHYLQHVPFEDPANIVPWAKHRGHKLTGTHLYKQEALPAMDQLDWLIIMGGPMNIYEEAEYPWLSYEKEFIKEAIARGKAVVGICLGGQLIADVLGGKVTKNPEGEIGWLPVRFNAAAFQSPLFKNFPEVAQVFHWHNDTFSTLGKDSVCIAGSEACGHQAFIHRDRVVGFQFHMESTSVSIAALIEHCGHEMTGGAYVQNAAQVQAGMEFVKPANALMADFFEQLERIT